MGALFGRPLEEQVRDQRRLLERLKTELTNQSEDIEFDLAERLAKIRAHIRNGDRRLAFELAKIYQQTQRHLVAQQQYGRCPIVHLCPPPPRYLSELEQQIHQLGIAGVQAEQQTAMQETAALLARINSGLSAEKMQRVASSYATGMATLQQKDAAKNAALESVAEMHADAAAVGEDEDAEGANDELLQLSVDAAAAEFLEALAADALETEAPRAGRGARRQPQGRRTMERPPAQQ